MFKVKSQTASSYCISTVSLQAVVNHVWTHSKTDFWEENRQETETETERESHRGRQPWGLEALLSRCIIVKEWPSITLNPLESNFNKSQIIASAHGAGETH